MTPPDPCRAPIATVLTRLRRRPFEVRQALGGAVLTATVAVTGSDDLGYAVVFSPDGHVSVLREGDLPEAFNPQVRLHGTPEQLLNVVLGQTTTADAVFGGVLDLSVPAASLTPHYTRIMRLIREEVWALLGGHPEPG